jgi:hypothetical protein
LKLFEYKTRAAMKMANLDAVFDFMFTDPKYADGVNVFLGNRLTLENINFKLIV